MKCKKCGFEFDDQFSFCPKCGIGVVEKTTQEHNLNPDVILVDKDVMLARAQRSEKESTGDTAKKSQDWYIEQMNNPRSVFFVPNNATTFITADNRTVSFKDVVHAKTEEIIEPRNTKYMPESAITESKHGDNIFVETFKDGHRVSKTEKSYAESTDLLKNDSNDIIIKQDENIREVVTKTKRPRMEEIAEMPDITVEEKMLEMSKNGYSDTMIIRWLKKQKEE